MIITLCGSTRFKDEFEKINKKLTLEGNIVLAPGVFGHSSAVEPSPEIKTRLDDLHKEKITMSDAIYVINKDGYIGESTRSEIAFAEKLGKKIIMME